MNICDQRMRASLTGKAGASPSSIQRFMNIRAVSRWALVAVLAAGISAAFLAREVRAQAYKWKDSNGHIHFTENYYEIPDRYRKQVETREMPTQVDPNQAAAEAAAKTPQGAAAASFEDGLRQGMGNMTAKQEQALHAWLSKWMWWWIGAVIVNVIIALSMVIHAFVNGKIGWGLANFFIGVSSPFYLMMHVEQSVVVRLGLLFLYLLPLIIGGVAGAELAGVLQ
jgi:uncharacterized protein DUF4124